MNSMIFHLAFPVTDLDEVRTFYVDKLGCSLGRQSPASMILGLAGNQIVAQKVDENPKQKSIYPRHFGLVFEDLQSWENFVQRVRDHHIDFFLEPKTRHEGQKTEYRTFFIEDPSHNILEFKWYKDFEVAFGNVEGAKVGLDYREGRYE